MWLTFLIVGIICILISSLHAKLGMLDKIGYILVVVGLILLLVSVIPH